MNYAEIKNCDIANGPGVRVSVFVSGCNHHCKGCFNEVAWDFEYGQPFTQDTINHIIELMKPPHIVGLTILGGEPLDPLNQVGVYSLIVQVKNEYPDKSIWLFTGYDFERDIVSNRVDNNAALTGILRQLDVIVDGPFIESQKDLTLRFHGSSNQRLIDVRKTLESGQVVLWDDWQTTGGMRAPRNY